MYPEGISLEAETAHEAMTALAQWPGFREEDNTRYDVYLPDFPVADMLHRPTDVEVIRVMDAEEMGASGKAGAYLQIIVGVIVIWASWGTATAQGYAMILSGVAMIAGGVSALLMPAPKTIGNQTDEKSKYLPANQNTLAAGTPIPMIFGVYKVWPHILSYNITATNISEPALTETLPEGGGGGGGGGDPGQGGALLPENGVWYNERWLNESHYVAATAG